MKAIDETLKIINRYNIIMSVIYIALSLFAWSFSKTLGVSLGVVLMTANFLLIAFLVQKAFEGGKIRPLPFVLYLVKFLVLFGAAFLILRWKAVNKLFFFFGTTVILPSLLMVSYRLRKVSGNN